MGFSLSNILGSVINPAALFEDDNEAGSILNWMTDPMDLFGERANATQDEMSGILESSARAGIEAQETQRQKIIDMYQPFYDSAVDSALPQLQAMAEGGDVDYTPSKLYEYSKERGERNIRRAQASQGLLESSGTEERMSDYRSGLAQEETERLYAGQLSRVQLGADAGTAVSSASSSLAGNVSGLYSNLGSGLNAASQAYGNARQSAYQGLSSTLTGLSQYMGA